PFAAKRRRPVLLAVPVLAGLFLVPGCDDTYSAAIEYGVRTDPVFTETPGEEQYDPDRPGQLPLFVMNDLRDPRNPFDRIRGKYVDKGAIRDPNLLKTEDRKDLETTLNDNFGTPARPRVPFKDAVVKALK